VNWRRIEKEAETGDPVAVRRSAFDDDPLERLPEDATLLVHDEPTLWISRELSSLCRSWRNGPNGTRPL